MQKIDYLKLLEYSFEMERSDTSTRLTYLSESIFNFTTYDSKMDELFAAKAVEVCVAINNSKTFEYIKEPENYRWYLLMCNMPFFAERLEWGTSIRGAWWGARPGRKIEFNSCGLWNGNEQLIDTLKFSTDEWKCFVAAIIEFAREEIDSE